MEESVERKIWKTGKGSYVTALPKKWAEKLEDAKIVFSEYKGGLFIMPSETKKRIKAKRKFDRNDPNMLKYEIISAYLNNYREILIEFKKPHKECINMLESLPKKLLGLSVSFVSSNTFLVSMSTMLKPIPEILKLMLSQCEAIHETNQETMSTLTLSEDHLERVRAIENDIDRNSFLVKRLFCVAATQIGLSEEVGIDDLVKIVHWETLNSNLERVGDLQLEACLELKRLIGTRKEGLKNKIHSLELNYGFREYHNSAYEMVKDAYSGESDKIAEILNTKKQSSEDDVIKHRGKYIGEEQGKAIKKLVADAPDLACLDVRIWGLTGCATNIAEAWLNMRGPSVEKITN